MKEWRVRKMLASLRKGRAYNETHGGGLRNLMRSHYKEEIPRLERELARRRKA